MMKSMKKISHSDAYVEWSFAVYPFYYTRRSGFPTRMWLCRIDLVGEMPSQVLSGGETPLQAFVNACALIIEARQSMTYLSRN